MAHAWIADGGEKNRVRRELLQEFELREWKNGSKGQRNWVAFTGNEGHGESWLPTTIGPVFHLREVCSYFQRAACVIVTSVDRILLPPATNSGNGDTGTKRKSRLFAAPGFSAKKLNAVSSFSLPGPFLFRPARMKNGKRFENCLASAIDRPSRRFETESPVRDHEFGRLLRCRRRLHESAERKKTATMARIG